MPIRALRRNSKWLRSPIVPAPRFPLYLSLMLRKRMPLQSLTRDQFFRTTLAA